MKKIIAYSKEDIDNITSLLNGMVLSGIQNWKRGAMIAQILESGVQTELKEDSILQNEKGERD